MTRNTFTNSLQRAKGRETNHFLCLQSSPPPTTQSRETWGHINHVQFFLTSLLFMEIGSEYFGILSNSIGNTKENLCKTKILPSKFFCLSFPLLFICFDLTREGQSLKELPKESALLIKEGVRAVWEWGMTTVSAVLLGRKQYFLTAWVESNISTINNLASPVVENSHYSHNFSQPGSTQGHHERDNNWCLLICECTLSKRATSSATWAEYSGNEEISQPHRTQTAKQRPFYFLSDLFHIFSLVDVHFTTF